MIPAIPQMGRIGRLISVFLSIAALWTSTLHAQAARDQYAAARNYMVENYIKAAGVTNERVLDAMRNTPRHDFVSAQHRKRAYYDMALPIGQDQTISSPFIVAYMTETLSPQPSDRVLEIGTGSGYQAAILSPLVDHVYSIEIVPELGRKAARTLRRLRYRNVTTKIGDGYQGWSEHAPFDKIIVTCSPEKPPVPLIEQLKEGGLMVIPVGERYQQTLYLLRKRQGQMVAEALRPTLFVPMTGVAEDNRVVQPDPQRPKCRNGDFEAPVPENGFVRGWYYQRQMTVEHDEAPQGKSYVRFTNSEDNLSSHLLQGIPVDGQAVSRIQLAAKVRYENVFDGSAGGFSTVAITFYDESRKELSARHLGRLRGTSEWKEIEGVVPVPEATASAILRIGLFGATGQLDVDDVQFTPVSAP